MRRKRSQGSLRNTSHAVVYIIFQFRHTVEGGVAGNVMVELPQAGSATTFYGEEPTTGT